MMFVPFKGVLLKGFNGHRIQGRATLESIAYLFLGDMSGKP